MFESSTIVLQVFTLTPVVNSLEVVTIVGTLLATSSKLSNCALPVLSSPVILMT